MAEDNFFSRWSRRKAEVRGGAVPASTPDPARGDATTVLPPDPAQHTAVTGAALTQPPPAESVRGGRGNAADNATNSATGNATDSATHRPAEPAPTMSDVARLTPQSDYTRFVAPGVDNQVKQAAMKKLFADPHFNRMDGLDVYIDDYTQSTPIPMSVLRQMVQSRALGLFQDEDRSETTAAPGAEAGEQRTDRGPQAAAGARPDGSVEQDVPASHESTDIAQDQANDLAGTHDEDPDLQLQPDHAAGSGRAGPGPRD